MIKSVFYGVRLDIKLVNDLDYDWVEFPVQEKDFSKIEMKTTFELMYFIMKISWLFQSIFQIKTLKTQWICCLQLMKTSHIMCLSKILTDLCFKKQIIKIKNICKSCLQCFSSKNMLTEHKEVCLSINGAQSVNL